MKNNASSAAIAELQKEVERLRAEKKQWLSLRQEKESLGIERQLRLQLQQENDLLLAQRQQLLEQQQQNAREIEQLQHRLQCLLRQMHGRSAEKIDPRQMLLFKDLLEQLALRSPVPPKTPEPPAAKQPPKGHGRKPASKDLPRTTVVHDLTEEEKSCPCCGGMRHVIGREVKEEYDYIPPKLSVIEHVQLKYGCRHCEQTAAEGGPQIVLAPKPMSPIEKGLAAPGLLAYVIVSKYGDHLPLYRLEHILDRYGIKISRSTMGGWMTQCAGALHPLYDRLVHYAKLSDVIHTDDTPVYVLDETRDRARIGRFWVYVGDPRHPYSVFDYTPNRSQSGPVEFLKNWSGYLQADAFGGYDCIYRGIAGGIVIEVACWSHARRKFYEARSSNAEASTKALAFIRLLYDVEDEAKKQFKKQNEGEGWRSLAEIRLALRQEFAAPRLVEFENWLRSQQAENGGPILPKSPVGEAITYALNQWKALCVYTTCGELDIDNNVSENAVRCVAVGRKNWLFCGSDNGGRTAAVMFSLISSCKRHSIDPFTYLRDVLTRIASTPLSRLDDLLPDRWKAAQAQSEIISAN